MTEHAVDGDRSSALDTPRRRSLVIRALAAAIVAAAVAAWVWSANDVRIRVSRDGVDVTRYVVAEGDPDPLVIEVSPARRADSSRVLLDGDPVPHPEGAAPGELLWFADDLRPGMYVLEIRVPRPTWFEAVHTVAVEVRPSD